MREELIRQISQKIMLTTSWDFKTNQRQFQINHYNSSIIANQMEFEEK